MSVSLSSTAAMRTSPGVVRPRNEDAAYVDGRQRLFVVADGMGGRSAGHVASAMAVATVRQIVDAAAPALDAFAVAPSQPGRFEIRSLLERAVHAASAAVLQEGRRDPTRSGMGTTLDVVLVLAGEAFVAHVGDGRAYLIRDGVAQRKTDDHTMAHVMLRAGTFTSKEAEDSPLRSVLSNSIGSAPDVAIDHVHISLRPGDRLLVCTDGMHEYFTPEEIAGRVSHALADAALDQLLRDACARGGHDNITGILVDIDTPAAPEDELDDAITTPISVPVEPVRSHTPALPLADVSDETLAEVVDHVLREASRPHRARGTRGGERAGSESSAAGRRSPSTSAAAG